MVHRLGKKRFHRVQKLSVKDDILTAEENQLAHRSNKNKEDIWNESMAKRDVVTTVEGCQNADEEASLKKRPNYYQIKVKKVCWWFWLVKH